MLTAAALPAQVGEQKECRCGHKPPLPVLSEGLGPSQPASPTCPSSGPRRLPSLWKTSVTWAPEFVDAQIEAEESMDEQRRPWMRVRHRSPRMRVPSVDSDEA
jgi:hypothetical protein